MVPIAGWGLDPRCGFGAEGFALRGVSRFFQVGVNDVFWIGCQVKDK